MSERIRVDELLARFGVKERASILSIAESIARPSTQLIIRKIIQRGNKPS